MYCLLLNSTSNVADYFLLVWKVQCKFFLSGGGRGEQYISCIGYKDFLNYCVEKVNYSKRFDEIYITFSFVIDHWINHSLYFTAEITSASCVPFADRVDGQMLKASLLFLITSSLRKYILVPCSCEGRCCKTEWDTQNSRQDFGEESSRTAEWGWKNGHRDEK